MFTRCPDCLTQYRVRATQLGAAGGRVRCGACGAAFDAVSRLSDDPLPPPAPEETGAGGELLTGQAGPLDDDELPLGLRSDRGADSSDPVAADGLPDWPGDEPAPVRHTGRWLLLALLLLLLGLGQVAWFHRDALYERIPPLAGWVEQLCSRIDCEVYRQRDTGALALLNRDVRAHPVYEDALLVNATIINLAGHRQPYPQLQLALYDTEGRVLAYREFAPDDYLDASMAGSAGMPVETPLHVVLELGDAGVGAVSFEFGFL